MEPKDISGRKRAKTMKATKAKKMLKVELHCHTRHKKDPYIEYGWKELIDHYASLKYDILAITNHHELFYDKEAFAYAKKKGILMIPSTEASVEGRDILIINIRKDEKIPSTFEELKKFKRESSLIIAPHPFFIMHSLGKELEKHIELFDGIEYSHFYTGFFNLNSGAKRIAEKYNLPMIGTSDTHHLFQAGQTYTMVDCSKNPDSLIKAIKRKKCRLVTKGLQLLHFLRIVYFGITSR